MGNRGNSLTRSPRVQSVQDLIHGSVVLGLALTLNIVPECQHYFGTYEHKKVLIKIRCIGLNSQRHQLYFMEASLNFLGDYLQQTMVYKVLNDPLLYETIHRGIDDSNQKLSHSILSTGSKDNSLQVRDHDDVRINSIDLVEQKHDGSRARKKLTNETMEEFIDSSRKRHLTSFLEQRNSRKKKDRSQSPASQIQLPRGKIFHIGCDYRLKPKFAQHQPASEY